MTNIVESTAIGEKILSVVNNGYFMGISCSLIASAIIAFLGFLVGGRTTKKRQKKRLHDFLEDLKKRRDENSPYYKEVKGIVDELLAAKKKNDSQ